MREILFRGKRIDNEVWAEGDLIHSPDGRVAISTDDGLLEVQSVTIDQYTGLNDRNDRKIFEGDILKLTYDYEESFYVVFWSAEDAMWKIRAMDVGSADDMSYWHWAEWEVVGNTFDNPELVSG